MQAIPLIHRSTLIPAIAILDEIGAPTTRLLSQQRLPSLDYPASTYVPLAATLAFTHNAAQAQGLWGLGFDIAERVTIQRASRWGPRAATAVTLRHAIQTMSDWIRIDMPEIRIGLDTTGQHQWFWRGHEPDRRNWSGYYLGEQYMLGLMVQLIRMAEGPNWYPSRLKIEAAASDWAFKRPEFAREASIEFGAPRTAIELPVGSLDRRMPTMRTDSDPKIVRDTGERPALDLQGSLRQVLKSVACERKLTLEMGAELSCSSERSLQRSLADAGTSWREITDRVHLETTLDLMDDPAYSLADIASILGYSQYPHFCRAFQRWTRETPSAYRKRLI